MCKFFSLVTCPDMFPGRRFYFDWDQRQEMIATHGDGADSHDHIIAFYKLDPDRCNCYEYNPLLKTFEVDKRNSSIDDRVQAEEWVRSLDFKRIVESLVIKPIVNPLMVDYGEVTDEVKELLWLWASVGASVWASVWDSVGSSVRASVGASVWASVGSSVGASVWDSVGSSVWDSVRSSVRDSVWDSVRASVWAYTSSFFSIEYKHNLSPCIKLWEAGFVPSFDGKTWRLHAGKNAKIVYEMKGD